MADVAEPPPEATRRTRRFERPIFAARTSLTSRILTVNIIAPGFVPADTGRDEPA